MINKNLLLSTEWLFCVTYSLLYIFLFCVSASFPLFIMPGTKMLQEFSAQDESDRDTRARWMSSF